MNGVLQLFFLMMAIMVPASLIVFVREYFRYKRESSQRISELKQAVDDNSPEEMQKEMQKEIAELKERIIVLESIVTDRGYELGQKISNL